MSEPDKFLEIGEDGQRFVLVTAVMPLLVAFADGLSMVSMDGRHYLPVESALSWMDRQADYIESAEVRENFRKAREVLVAFRDAPENILLDEPFRFNNITKRMEPADAS
jgi:hypothetical protein